jgi:membrane protease YdiL (CAAX protease family)
VLEPVPDSAPVPAPDAGHSVQWTARLGALAEVLLCSGFPSQLFIITVLTGFGMSMRTAEGALSPRFTLALATLDTLLLIGMIFFFLRAHGERASDVLLGSRSIPGEIFVGLVLLPVMFLLVVVVLATILTVAPQLHNVPRNPLEDMLQSRRDVIVFGVVATIAGGVREEIQRGFILHRFDRYLGGGTLGLILFSTVFGLGHIYEGYDVALATAVLGGVWGLVYLLRRSIVAPMVSHAGFNLAQLVKYVALG